MSPLSSADHASGTVVIKDKVVTLTDVQGHAADGTIKTHGTLDFKSTPSRRRAGAVRSPCRASLRSGTLNRRMAMRYNPIMNASTTTWQYLAPNPNSCYKQLFVKGTRIRAGVLYGMFMAGEPPMTPECIASEFNLPSEAVKEAIVYCQSNPPEIAEDHEREGRFMQASGMDHPDYKIGGKFKVVPPEEVARILKS